MLILQTPRRQTYLTLSVTFGPLGFSSANAKPCTSRKRTAPQTNMVYKPVLEQNFRLKFRTSTVKMSIWTNRNHEFYNMALSVSWRVLIGSKSVLTRQKKKLVC